MKFTIPNLIKPALLTGLIFTVQPAFAKSPSEALKGYWYAGDAELTSYELKQARYGEIHEGTSVLVYVTEPFLAKEQIKADNHKPDNIPVLKLNSTKKILNWLVPLLNYEQHIHAHVLNFIARSCYKSVNVDARMVWPCLHAIK